MYGSLIVGYQIQENGHIMALSDGKSVAETWRSLALEMHWTRPVLHAGNLFAFSGRDEPDARFRAVELATEIPDIARNQLHRVPPDLEGEVLRVDAKRVISQRFEDRMALQALEARVDITSSEREEVPDVQPFG